MKKKITLVIILACCCLCTFIAGAVGMVACENDSPNSSEQHWTSNY